MQECTIKLAIVLSDADYFIPEYLLGNPRKCNPKLLASGIKQRTINICLPGGASGKEHACQCRKT